MTLQSVVCAEQDILLDCLNEESVYLPSIGNSDRNKCTIFPEKKTAQCVAFANVTVYTLPSWLISGYQPEAAECTHKDWRMRFS